MFFIERDETWPFLPPVGMDISYFLDSECRYDITVKALRYNIMVGEHTTESPDLIIECVNFRTVFGRGIKYDATPYQVVYDTDELIQVLEATGWTVLGGHKPQTQEEALAAFRARIQARKAAELEAWKKQLS